MLAHGLARQPTRTRASRRPPPATASRATHRRRPTPDSLFEIAVSRRRQRDQGRSGHSRRVVRARQQIPTNQTLRRLLPLEQRRRVGRPRVAHRIDALPRRGASCGARTRPSYPVAMSIRGWSGPRSRIIATNPCAPEVSQPAHAAGSRGRPRSCTAADPAAAV